MVMTKLYTPSWAQMFMTILMTLGIGGCQQQKPTCANDDELCHALLQRPSIDVLVQFSSQSAATEFSVQLKKQSIDVKYHFRATHQWLLTINAEKLLWLRSHPSVQSLQLDHQNQPFSTSPDINTTEEPPRD